MNDNIMRAIGANMLTEGTWPRSISRNLIARSLERAIPREWGVSSQTTVDVRENFDDADRIGILGGEANGVAARCAVAYNSEDDVLYVAMAHLQRAYIAIIDRRLA